MNHQNRLDPGLVQAKFDVNYRPKKKERKLHKSSKKNRGLA